jgi:transcriptional regulator with XRE-family HTH domain
MGLKQRELADRLPVTATYLSHLENDRVEPSIKLLKKIADELNTPIEVLFWDSVEVPDNASPDDRRACELAKLVVRHWYESQRAAGRRNLKNTLRKAARSR